MRLSDYLEANEITYAEFARMIEVSGKDTVRRYATGQRTPTPKVMARIALATECKVTANDFLGIGAAA